VDERGLDSVAFTGLVILYVVLVVEGESLTGACALSSGLGSQFFISTSTFSFTMV
jgi:hypothetical protein